jgi:hypothetical protein
MLALCAQGRALHAAAAAAAAAAGFLVGLIQWVEA